MFPVFGAICGSKRTTCRVADSLIGRSKAAPRLGGDIVTPLGPTQPWLVPDMHAYPFVIGAKDYRFAALA